MARFCQKCGKEINEGENYCADCKNTITAPDKSNENGIAIAGFVCALIGFNIVGLILSIIGLSNTKKYNAKNKGFAIAGIIISIIKIILLIFIVTLLVLIPKISRSIDQSYRDTYGSTYDKYDYDYEYNFDYDD